MAHAPKRDAFIKLSGELLARGNDGGMGWNKQAIDSVAANIAKAYHERDELGISGLTLVLGGGNIARGASLREIFGDLADGVGRLGTLPNTLAVSVALERLGIPHIKLLTHRMHFKDVSIDFESYSPEKVHQAHDAGQIVLIAGGTGEEKKSTDQAVVSYATDHAKSSVEPISVLKGTSRVDGVYDGDPHNINGPEAPRRIQEIGADYMLNDYERFAVVDRSSLEQLAAQEALSMFIYQHTDDFGLSEVLRHDPRIIGTNSGVGTIIVPRRETPIYY